MRPYQFHLKRIAAESSLNVMPSQLRESLASVSILGIDVDGVLTDGSRVLSENGRALVSFHARDGLGIVLLERAGVQVAFVSAISSPIVKARARELGVRQVWLGINNKLRWVEEARKSSGGALLFIGDDLWDLSAMKASDISVAVSDAVPEVVAAADIVSAYKGGKGAVRQIADLLLVAKNVDRERLMGEI